MVNTDHHILHFTARGEGVPVVLLHGLGSSLQEWERITQTLVEGGYRVYACDLLGHGASPQPGNPGKYHIQVVHEALVEWIDSLHLEQPFFMAGHSLGGYLTLMFASQFPSRLRGQLLIDPFYSLDQLPNPLRSLPQLFYVGQKIMHAIPYNLMLTSMRLPFISTSHFPLWVSQQQAQATKEANPRIGHFIQGIPSLEPQLEQIQPPGLVIWGEQDRLCNPQSFQTLINCLPHAQGFSLPGCGHHPHLEKPEEVSQRILAFMNGL